MDQALSRELLAFKKKKTNNLKSDLVDGVDPSADRTAESGSRKRKALSNQKGKSSNNVAALNNGSLPPQVANNLKKNKTSLLRQNNLAPTNDKSFSNKYYCSNKTKNSLLAVIVDFLKDKYFEQLELLSTNKKQQFDEDAIAFTLHEILDKTQNLNTAQTDQAWLVQNALPNNPRIKKNTNKFQYKPYYEVYDRRALLKLLENFNNNGYGGILIDELRDSMINTDQIILALRNRMFHLTRNSDKKDVIFYFDPQYVQNIDEDLTPLWKSINVEGIDEKGIEKYLSMANISCFNVSPAGLASMNDQKNDDKKSKGRGRQAKLHNVHLADGILKDYNF